MKKLCIVVFAVLLFFVLTACGKGNNEDALLDLGIDVAKTMQEMVYSDAYISLYSSMEFEGELAKFRATDYDSPIAVYSIEAPGAKDILSKLGSGNIDDYDLLSDNLKEQLDCRASFSTIASSINAQSGTDTLALCSLLTATKYGKDIELDESVTYLYVFEKGMPIAVTFTEAGCADGRFLMLGDSKSYEDICDIFSQYSCEVNTIQ